jgi:hypothetical protein
MGRRAESHVVMVGPAGSDPNSHSWASSLLAVLESLLKVSGLLAAIGFIGLRAYLSRFGLSEVSSPSTAQYLGSFYALLSDAIFDAQVIFLVLAIPSIVVLMVLSAPARLRKVSSLSQRILAGTKTPAVLLGAILLFQWWFLRGWSRVGANSVVGDLSGVSAADAAGSDLLLPLCLAVAVSGLLCWGDFKAQQATDARRPGFSTRICWLACRVVLLTMVLYIPILYGKFVLDPNYPVASMHSPDGDVCGLLITHDSSEMVLWRMDGTRGRLFFIPRSNGVQVEIHPSNTIGTVIQSSTDPCAGRGK